MMSLNDDTEILLKEPESIHLYHNARATEN